MKVRKANLWACDPRGNDAEHDNWKRQSMTSGAGSQQPQDRQTEGSEADGTLRVTFGNPGL